MVNSDKKAERYNRDDMSKMISLWYVQQNWLKIFTRKSVIIYMVPSAIFRRDTNHSILGRKFIGFKICIFIFIFAAICEASLKWKIWELSELKVQRNVMLEL